MPGANPDIIARREEIAAALAALCPAAVVITAPEELRPYETDGLTAYRQPPLLTILPSSTEEVSAILAYCNGEGIPVVPRGAGTSLSGGALPAADAVLLGMARFDRILKIDLDNRAAIVQPGVTNLAITRMVEAEGFHYAPDPSSQIACTIGGNVAENAGGVHCLKYGLTTNNILGLEMVLMDGSVIRLGGMHLDSESHDILGLMIGSEGLMGVVTQVTVRLTPTPASARAVLAGFDSAQAAGECVAGVISAGIIPAGMEMMDGPAIRAAEDFVHAGYPLDVEALLIIEVDGPQVEVDDLVTRVSKIAKDCGAVSIRASRSDEERLAFWAGRKAAFPAVGRISPDYYCMDGTIPRNRLTDVLGGIAQLSEKYGLACANVFHAGDGNLHPLILYDANRPGELKRAEDFGADILRLCVRSGGVLTGEHGVGVEKRDLMPEMFNDTDLAVQMRLKCALDPGRLLNPGKVFPQLKGCGEVSGFSVRDIEKQFPGLPRF